MMACRARAITHDAATILRAGSIRHLSSQLASASATTISRRNMSTSKSNRYGVQNGVLPPTSNRSNKFVGFSGIQRRTMFIQTANTPNQDALKFIPSTTILPPGARTVEFVNGREAHSSPLARKLFAVDGVRSVMFGPDFITVEKDPFVSWAILKPEVFSILTEFLSSGAKILLEDTAMNEDTMPQEGDSETVSMIKELIDTRIRPAIQEDGGDIEYRGLTDEGVVQLKLRGACRTCDSSAVTLKNGIEAMLMHYVDGVTGIEQVLDPEEEVSLREFEKFEEKLKKEKGGVPPSGGKGYDDSPRL
ncbi:scaffold protein Nfu/NifU N terminal-domain-containing protein [Lipomyces orientalis]|uniref:Scaffold protein Nfu/NifU N terminal-domain-containing protein n=1 Tax=Lipomyces orientalis TaxID=1233043 RepID=A0ACC3TKF2_9ASCO